MKENSITFLKSHVSINVSDIDVSVQFYERLFGIKPLKYIGGNAGDRLVGDSANGHGYAKFDVQNPPLNFVLNQSETVSRGALSHFGLQVASTDDVLKVRERWVAEGLITSDEMQVDCCYALQDKTWVRDPDGNEWEAFVVLADTNRSEADACECGNKVAGESEPHAARCSADEAVDKIAVKSQSCC